MKNLVCWVALVWFALLASLQAQDVFPTVEIQKLYQEKQFSKIIEFLEPVVLASDGGKQTELLIFILGDSYYQMKKYTKAIDVLNRVAEGVPQGRFVQKAYYLMGCSYFYLGYYFNALGCFGRLTKVKEKETFVVSVDFWLGETLFRLAAFQAASNFYKKALSETKDAMLLRKIYYALSLCMFNLRHWDESVKYLDYLITDDLQPEPRVLLLFRKARILSLLGRFIVAKNLLLEIQKLGVSSAWNEKSSFELAVLDYKIGNFKQASERCMDYLKRYKSSKLGLQVLYLMAQSYFRDGQYEQAYRYFDMYYGLVKNPGLLAETRVYMGLSLYNMGQYEKALSEFKKVVDAFPQYAFKAIYHAAWTWIRLGKEDHAAQLFETLVQDFSEHALVSDVALWLIDYYEEKGLLDKKEALLQWVLERSEEPELKAESSYLLAQMYAQREQVDLALEALRPIGEGQAYFLEATLLKSSLFMKQGRYAESLSLLKNLHSFDGADRYSQEISLALGQTYEGLNDDQQALKAYREALYGPDEVRAFHAHVAMGLLQYKLKHWDEALKFFQDVPRKFNAFHDQDLFVKSIFYLGWCYEKLKRWNEAALTYKSVLQWPSSEYVDLVDERLAILNQKRG